RGQIQNQMILRNYRMLFAAALLTRNKKALFPTWGEVRANKKVSPHHLPISETKLICKSTYQK
ncbi:MAG: hypothetical protein IJC21_00060, partial [Lentisphaeria bacterium]|nr:hypothetical protein [Lentisphaeria bacterium]